MIFSSTFPVFSFKTKPLVLAVSFLCVLPSLSYANQTPRSMAFDHRIKTVSYNPDDVVTIRGNHLVDTEIQFNQNESIIDSHIGDPYGWDVEFNKSIPFVLFIKPKLLNSNTNMTVITNKRIYRFNLVTTSKDSSNSKNVIYALTFDYPDQDQARLTQQLNTLSQNFMGNTNGTPQHWNFNYSFCGSKAIAPIQAVDNGTFTVFKFPKNTVIPAIFSVDKYRNESLVNFRVQGDYVFIQSVSHQYTLRNGQNVTTVYNDSFPVR